jgi:hypothetical protein
MAIRQMRNFRPEERRVDLANGTVVYLPPVAGSLKQWLPSQPSFEVTVLPADGQNDALERALAAHEIVEQERLQLDLETTSEDADVVEVWSAVGVPAGTRLVLLYRDESGGLSWHFARRDAVGVRERFVVPLRTAAARASLRLRQFPLAGGIVTNVGRKILRVLAVPLPQEPMSTFVRRWEEHRGHEKIRRVTPDDFNRGEAPRFTDWDQLARGRGLLLTHGLFSSTGGMLSQLRPEQMRELYERYQGRVIAFDHFTVSRSPEENASRFLEELRARGDNRSFEFDVLAHGRGGIVARTLCERASELAGSDAARIANIFFAGTPNHGSALASPPHTFSLIDVFTNLAMDEPGGSSAYSLDVLLALVRCAGLEDFQELAGIRDLQPGPKGYIERVLNKPVVESLDRYAAVAARYEPAPERDNGFFVGTFAERIAERVFEKAPNDFVVRTADVYERIGAQQGTIRHRIFERDVSGAGFFANPETVDRALEHFGMKTPASLPQSEPVLLKRDPSLVFHESVVARKPEELVVALNEVAAQAAAKMNIVLPGGAEHVNVMVRVFAPGFHVIPDVQRMVLRPTRNAKEEEARFELTAHDVPQPTKRPILVDFSIGTVPVGGISHVTTVMPADQNAGAPLQPPPTPPHFSVASGQRNKPDLKIAVTALRADESEVLPPFPLAVTSLVEGMSYDDTRCGSFTPHAASMTEYLQTTIGPHVNARPSPDGLTEDEFAAAIAEWNAAMIQLLRNLGMKLWEWLPKEFKALYFRHVDENRKPRSLLVNSVEMYFPWELVVPWRDLDGATREVLKPLGQAHIIGRWRPTLGSRPEPQSYPLRRIALLHPEYAGPWALAGAREEGN